MALEIEWPQQWDPDFVERLRSKLEQRIHSAMPQAHKNSYTPIRGSPRIERLHLGSKAPRLFLRSIREASAERIVLEVHLHYDGDAYIAITGATVNFDPGSAVPVDGDEERDRYLGDANHARPFPLPFDGKIVNLVLDGIFLIDIALVDVAFGLKEKEVRAPPPVVVAAERAVTQIVSDEARNSPLTSPKPHAKTGLRLAKLPPTLLARRAHGANAALSEIHRPFQLTTEETHLSATSTPYASAAPLRSPSSASGMRSLMTGSTTRYRHVPGHVLRDDIFLRLPVGTNVQPAVTMNHTHGRSAGSTRTTNDDVQQKLSFVRMALHASALKPRRLIRIRSFSDPVQSFNVESNFNSVAGNGLTKILRLVLKPVIDKLMSDGFELEV
jgi:hypothetical protein